MSTDQSLAERHIFIVGATSGMERATAFVAAEKGASLVLLGRDSTRLEEVSSTAANRGAASVLTIQTDASQNDALASALSNHADALAKVDTLVNTIDVNLVQRAFMDLTADSWAGMIDTNLNAAFNLSKLIVPVFRNRGGGLLINVSSTAARKPDPSGAAYQATKAGHGDDPRHPGRRMAKRHSRHRHPARHDRHAAVGKTPHPANR